MTDGNTSSNHAVQDLKWYVKIGYRVNVVDGPVLKGAEQPEIMDFITGFQQVVPGLEKRLIGRETGERLSFDVPPEEAFGPRFEELQVTKPISEVHLPQGMTPVPGMEIPVLTGMEQGPDSARVVEVTPDSVVLDLNHSLAGRTLHYELEILESRPAKEQDMCAEWEEQPVSNMSCSAVQHIVFGEDPPEED